MAITKKIFELEPLITVLKNQQESDHPKSNRIIIQFMLPRPWLARSYWEEIKLGRTFSVECSTDVVAMIGLTSNLARVTAIFTIMQNYELAIRCATRV